MPPELRPSGTQTAEPALPTGRSGVHHPAETFGTFNDWAARYLQASTPAARHLLEFEGVELARTRREALAGLIRSDPEAALNQAVGVGVRAMLPAAVTELLEERVNGHGDLAVLAALPEPGKESEVEPVWRIATVGAREYQAFVYGRRLGEPTRRHLPLSGIAVDDLLAVWESPLQVLPPDQAQSFLGFALEEDCAVCEEPVAVRDEPVLASVGAELLVLCCPEHAAELEEDLTAAESGGPSGDTAEGGEPQASAWTEGTKAVILIRVDFSDLIGVSLTEGGGATLIDNLHNFYHEMSYGRAGFLPIGAGSAVTPVLRMPETASYYGGNNRYAQLRTDARAAATAAGYVLSQYNLDVICMGPVPGFGWAGLAYVGSAGAWLRNSFGTGVAGHELGHNFGLHHAGFWDTSGQSIIGPGTHVEYGDSFDTMGSASAGNNHFNARYKSYLNWLQPSETLTVSSSGIYRIYAHDQPLTPGARGLRIVRNSTTNYWVEFRQKFTANRWLMNGAGLRFAGNGNQRSVLLDTTVGSSSGRTDSALVIGRTYADPEAGLYITPMGKGGTTPESLDVMVQLGGSAGNLPPSVMVSASDTVTSVNVPVDFSAAASDPNGDALAYYWDFGDGTFGSNSPNVSKSWSSTGDRVVRCTVTDMKGGEASHSVVISVGSSSTYRIQGVVTDGHGPVHGARVFVSSTRMAYTDSDGSYVLVGLASGSYTVNASLYPHTFVAVGFSNPVRLGPDAADINFSSSTVLPPTITGQPQSQLANLGDDVSFTVGATGTEPITYQWRWNGANIAGATAATYTRRDVQETDGGHYSVLVSNPGGSVASASALLTINSPPRIVGQPQDQDVVAGANVTFLVAADGSAPMNYQWRHNGLEIPGATGSSYTRSEVQFADAGEYTVRVWNAYGSVESAVARLNVYYGLSVHATPGGTVMVEPNQRFYAPGTKVTLLAQSQSVYVFSGWGGDIVSSENPITFTLTSNLDVTAFFASPVPDLIVDNPEATFTGNWAVETAASDRFGSNYRTAGSAANSASATATFTPQILTAGRYDLFVWYPTIPKPASRVPVQIAHHHGDQAVSLNQTSGAGQWQLIAAGVPFAPGNSGFVRLSNNVGQGGRTVVADAVRWVYSLAQEAVPPVVLTEPQDFTVPEGADAEMIVVAGGTAPLRYQWRRNGIDLPGATDPMLVLTNLQAGDAGGYSVQISNDLGQVISRTAMVTVLGAPLIVQEPQNHAVGVGGTAVFHVAVSGAAPLSYQWRKDDVDLADDERIQGAGSALLTVNSAIPSDAGTYTVLIQNPLGSVVSSSAFLNVGFEGDLAPVPYGDNRVDRIDQDAIGRLVAGLEEAIDPWQFARADCAPRESLGDGVLSLIDWVQAGRYAAGLDPLTPAGGPNTAVTPGARAASPLVPRLADEPAISTRVRVVGDALIRGRETLLTVELISQGNENAVAFTLEFDPATVSCEDYRLGLEEEGATWIVNSIQRSEGRLGFVLGLEPGTTFPVGSHALVQLTFTAQPMASSEGTEIRFVDEPVFRDLVGVAATAEPSVFDPLLLPLIGPSSISFRSVVMVAPTQILLTLEGAPGGRYAIESSEDLIEWIPLGVVTNLTGTVEFQDPVRVSQRRCFYRAHLVVEP
jgi:hypothetical protein